ncbi:hypothetical protein [Botrimarina sp.]|uniref:hypothetical protein n=1 Tax=Botrimarina sp. TaxID=2795802 RepID=UPI0032EDAE34
MDALSRCAARMLAAAAVALPVTIAVAAPPVRAVSFARSAGHRTENFTVRAPTPQLAREIGEAAERWRAQLAVEWLGEPMPNWSEPCPITAKVAPNLGAGGATSFMFDRGEVFGWEMNIQGSRERVLDSVLPHEITHTIFASHFRQPLPRWADEGACTTVEHRSEIAKQERMLIDFLKSNRGIDFVHMFRMTEYPKDILPLYAQGHSLTTYLIESRGKPAFMAFLADGMRHKNWRRAVSDHYGHDNLYALQDTWLDWVKSGRPRLDQAATPADAVAVATPAPRPEPTEIAAVGRSVAGRASVYAVRDEAGDTPERSSVYDASNRAPTVYR